MTHLVKTLRCYRLKMKGMPRQIMEIKTLFLAVGMSILTACSTLSVPNPFATGAKTGANVPENATLYTCEGNKRFYVRMLNNGNDAWLIYPDHEVNLPKSSDPNRYTSGTIALVLNGAATTLNDGEKIAYTACKPAVAK